VTVADDRIRVSGIAGGQATLTLTRDGLSAEAIVTVLASGAAIPEGTVLWESAALGEPSVKRGQVLRANHADDGSRPSADLFFVDEGTQGAGIYLYRVNDRPTQIRATTFDGQQLWSRTFSGEAIIKDVAADAYGGLILVLTDTFDRDGLPPRVQRIDGATGKVSWEYFAPDDGSLSEVAVHPEGTVFVSTEGYYYPDVTYVVGLNGETGAETRWRLPNGSSPTGPIVRDDGSVVVLFNPADDENFRHLQLATLADGGTLQISDTYLPSRNPYFRPDAYRLIPEEDGLVLAQVRDGTDMIRIGPDNAMGSVTTLLPPDIFKTVAQVDYAVGAGTGVAIIKRRSGQYNPPYNVYKASFDPLSLASRGVVAFGTNPYLTPRFIGSDGGVYISGEMFGSNDNQVAPGLWAGLGSSAFLVLGGAVDPGQPSSYLPGSTDSTNATWRGTIVVKCRPVDRSTAGAFGALHCYIVVERRDKTIRTIQGGELNGQPTGVLRVFNDSGERVGVNRPADPGYFFSDKVDDYAVVDCLENTASLIDQMHLPYHFLGPNSNSAVVEMMRVCGRPVALPAKAIGFNVPLGPWR